GPRRRCRAQPDPASEDGRSSAGAAECATDGWFPTPRLLPAAWLAIAGPPQAVRRPDRRAAAIAGTRDAGHPPRPGLPAAAGPGLARPRPTRAQPEPAAVWSPSHAPLPRSVQAMWPYGRRRR